MNAIDLNGQRAVVTGGAQGIGFAVADRLCRSGARVAVWDVDAGEAARAAKELPQGAASFAVDVTDPAAIERALAATERRSARSTSSSTAPASPA